MLQIKYTPAFSRDLKKKVAKRKWNLDELAHVIDLICENSPESTVELKSRHSMHVLAGQWHGSRECHVANAGDWQSFAIEKTRHMCPYFDKRQEGSHGDQA